MSNIDFSSKECKRSRTSYSAWCAIDYCIALMVSGVYLVKLFRHIGLSDALIGVVSSITSLAFLFQLLSIPLVRYIKDTRKTTIFLVTISEVMYFGIYFVPFMPVGRTVQTILVILLLLFAYIIKTMISGIYFKWAYSFVSPDGRGIYSATKEIISLVSGIVYMLAIAYVVDLYVEGGNLTGSFLFLGIMVGILNVASFVSVFLIGKDRNDEKITENKISFKQVATKTLCNKNFISVIILTIIYNVGIYSSTSFMGVYAEGELALKVMTIQIISSVVCVARIFVSRPIGRFSDKTSYATGIYLGLVIAAVGFGINMFTTPATWWFYIAYTLLYNISVAATAQNMENVCYSYVEDEYIVQALAIKNSIGGIVGFLTSIGASMVVEHIQSSGNMIFGMNMYAQQFLSGVSFVIILAGAFYCNKVIRKQKIINQ